MNKRTTVHGIPLLRKLTAMLLASGLILTAFTSFLNGQTVCLPPHEGLPHDWLPPTIDGYIEPELEFVSPERETGWTRATRLTYMGDTQRPLMVFQALEDNSGDFIYLSFNVRRDEYFDEQDTIILDFRPNYDPHDHTNERRIDIRPLAGGGTASDSSAMCTDITTGVTKPDGTALSSNIHLKNNCKPFSAMLRQWTGSGWSSPSALDSSGGITNYDIKVRSWTWTASNNNWSVEMKLPTHATGGAHPGGANWIDLSSNFGFYFDVIRVCGNSSGGSQCNGLSSGSTTPPDNSPLGFQYFDSVQYTWPRANYMTGERLILDAPDGTPVNFSSPNLIDPNWLGKAVLGNDSNCRGVRFVDGPNGIGRRDPAHPTDPTAPLLDTIDATLSATNTFVARLINDGAGSASGVITTFRIANFGITSSGSPDWALIPAKPASSSNKNPTNPQNVTGTTSTSPTEVTMDWQIDAADRTKYTGNTHQCIWVQLNAAGNPVDFADSSVRRNMNFINLSTYEEDVDISGRGFPPPTTGSNHLFMLRVSEVPVAVSRERIPRITYKLRSSPNGPDYTLPNEIELARAIAERQAQMKKAVTNWAWVADGFRYMGRTLTIGSKRFRSYDPVGSYGYVATHEGTNSTLNSALSGSGVKKLGDGRYVVEVPDGGVARVHTRLEATDAGGTTPLPTGSGFFTLGLRGGVAVPHSPFSNLYDPGGAFTADLEYHATNFFSVSGQFGYRRFSSGTTFVNGFNLFQFSGGPKVYLSSGTTRPFLNGGIGAFKFDPGSTKFGVYTGGGLQFRVWPKLWLEGEYDFHSVFTTGQNFKFSTVQGGIRIRF